ncbi:RNA 3'-terminal phosphate cyclase [Phytopseudomonas punonensis]|uniref:RNA 3'-terminal phosphate cyclase n=1 Tax=Phytopseudomonas punonensis TaxID=1220495 RepID=A0A1M6YB90_9GAMM|nr:RNA 3'-terminal phosphate cyclase [Pseudomonas punonensis]SHL15199.1 RNA 3'-terminal phosphate cyclase (ATP) [Pseudomonas punonensis]
MNKDMLELDGAIGGGQVLRTALSLSMITGTPFRIANIRAKRSRPGLLRQHLTAVLAAAEISGADVQGAEPHATSLVFRPGPIRGGEYRFAIGSAGSCTLVLQTILPALLQAAEPSRVHISGGTHNPAAPPFDFLDGAWLPLLRRMGGQVELQLQRHGFVPAGGGALEAFIQPSQLTPLHLHERGAVLEQRAEVLLAGIPGHVGERELARVGKRLQWPDANLRCTWLDQEHGPGNILMLTVACEQLTEQFCAFGQNGVRAEAVADQAVEPLRQWLASGAAVAEHLADQLLLPMALAGSGSFTTTHLSEHLQSNIQVIEAFCPVTVRCTPTGKALRVEMGSRA